MTTRYLKIRKNAVYVHKYVNYLNKPFSCVLNISNMTVAEYTCLRAELSTINTSITRINTKLFYSLSNLVVTGNSYLLACEQFENIIMFLQKLEDILRGVPALTYLNFIGIHNQYLTGMSLPAIVQLYKTSQLESLFYIQKIRSDILDWLSIVK